MGGIKVAKGEGEGGGRWREGILGKGLCEQFCLYSAFVKNILFIFKFIFKQYFQTYIVSVRMGIFLKKTGRGCRGGIMA